MELATTVLAQISIIFFMVQLFVLIWLKDSVSKSLKAKRPVHAAFMMYGAFMVSLLMLGIHNFLIWLHL